MFPSYSIVGAVVGGTIVGTAFSCLNWSFDGGLTAIIASWFISPIASGVIGTGMYLLTYAIIIRSKHSASRSLRSMPILYGTTSAGLSMLILIKSKPLKHLNIGLKVLISAIIGAFIGVATRIFLVPFVQKKMGGAHWISADGAVDKERKGAATEMVATAGSRALQPIKSKLSDTWEVSDMDNMDTAVENDAEGFLSTPKSLSMAPEELGDDSDARAADGGRNTAPWTVPFQYLLVFVAAWESFAHGANDTANATGAFAALYTTYRSGFDLSACESQATPVWVMAIAGAFVFIGMVRVTHACSEQICVSPSRSRVLLNAIPF